MMRLAQITAVPPLIIATLLSTTATAAVPDNAGVAIAVVPGSATVVEQLEGAMLVGRSFTSTKDGVIDLTMSDGTAIRLAPGSRFTIENYSFDEATHAREFVVRVDIGRVRIIGSDVNGFDAIRVLTPAGVGELQGGGVIEVAADGVTTTNLLFGDAFSLTANGETAEIYRPGFELRTEPEEDLDRPRRTEEGEAEQVAFALNPALAPAAGPIDQTPTGSFEESAEFEQTRQEAEQVGVTEDAVLAARRTFEDDLTSASDPTAPGADVIGGGLRAGADFGPGAILSGITFSSDLLQTPVFPACSCWNSQLGQTFISDERGFIKRESGQFVLQQGFLADNEDILHRGAGLTTNTIFSSLEYGTMFLADQKPLQMKESVDNSRLLYDFILEEELQKDPEDPSKKFRETSLHLLWA